MAYKLWRGTKSVQKKTTRGRNKKKIVPKSFRSTLDAADTVAPPMVALANAFELAVDKVMEKLNSGVEVGITKKEPREIAGLADVWTPGWSRNGCDEFISCFFMAYDHLEKGTRHCKYFCFRCAGKCLLDCPHKKNLWVIRFYP